MVARRWVGAGRQLRAPTTARRSPPPFNIVAIKDVCEDGRAVHIVMELFIVGELLDKIQEEGHYNERKAAEIKDDVLALSGFTELIGSPYYVAPEVLHRYVIDQNLRYCTYGPKSDVWSATVVLNVLMSGVPPFWAGHPWICESGVAINQALDPSVITWLKQFCNEQVKKLDLRAEVSEDRSKAYNAADLGEVRESEGFFFLNGFQVALEFLCKEDRYNVIDVKEVVLSVIESTPVLHLIDPKRIKFLAENLAGKES
uniref:OSJNBa0014K14.5 protein n=1 Tax=Oryza sativa subsp. japonica TaxID=39947 RepID=Q7XQX0_ORYSJ|nr:OSJNBa0014K14.5 [Oryza sativa Japonica Group]